eukprot:SAG25_NODE_94_length_15935_cov_41.063463_12_plen_101_part_00
MQCSSSNLALTQTICCLVGGAGVGSFASTTTLSMWPIVCSEPNGGVLRYPVCSQHRSQATNLVILPNRFTSEISLPTILMSSFNLRSAIVAAHRGGGKAS